MFFIQWLLNAFHALAFLMLFKVGILNAFRTLVNDTFQQNSQQESAPGYWIYLLLYYGVKMGLC